MEHELESWGDYSTVLSLDVHLEGYARKREPRTEQPFDQNLSAILILQGLGNANNTSMVSDKRK